MQAVMPEAQAGVIKGLIESELATTRDLTEMELRLKAELERHRAKLKAGIVQWVAGMLVAQAAVIAALVKLL